jgi:hypothetical protein
MNTFVKNNSLLISKKGPTPTPVTASSIGDGLISGVPANVSSYACP